MGEVWDAEHLEDRLPVAIKFIRPDRLGPAALRPFETEVRAIARLCHPGVVGVYDHGVLERPLAGLPAGSPWFAMERFGGGTLGEAPPRGWDEVRTLLDELLDALAATHAAGVVHRDLKPGNLLRARPTDPVRPGPAVRIVDFGLAQLDAEGALRAGTPTYMAPEQLDPSRGACDPTTDLYALGVLTWEWVTGAPPFRQEDPRLLAQAHLSLPPPAFLPRVEVPAALEGWVRRLLEKWPSQRYRSAAEAAWGLRLVSGPAWTAAVWPPPPEPAALPETATLAPGLAELAARPSPRLTATLHSTGWEAWGPTPAAPPPRGPVPAPRVAPPLPRDAHAGERRPAPLPHGAGRALLPWREPRLVGREAEVQRLWALAVEATEGRRVLLVRGVRGSGRRRLLRWLRERLGEWGRIARVAGADPLADLEALVGAEGPGPRLLVVEEGAPEGLGEGVPATAPVLIALVGGPEQPAPEGAEVLELGALPEARWSELVDTLLPLGPALHAAVERAAAGLPGRAVELVRALVGRGLVPGPAGFVLPDGAPLDVLELDLPERAAAAAARCEGRGERLALGVHAALGADAEGVLDVAVARVCADAGVEAPRGRPWLRSLVGLGLASPTPEGAHLLPDAAAALLALPDLDPRPLHLAARAAWEGCPDAARRERGIGEQLLALGETEAALKPLESAATWFMASDHHREALAVMATWERAMGGAPADHPRWLYGWCRLSYAAWQTGDFDEGERYGRLALTQAEARHAPHERVWPACNLAQLRLLGHDDVPGAEALLWRVEEEGLSDGDRVVVALARSALRARQGREEEAMALLEAVLDLPGAHPLRRAEARGDLVGLHLGRGEPGPALRRLDEAVALLGEAGLPLPPLLAIQRAHAILLGGEAERARGLATEALAEARRGGDAVAAIDAGLVLGAALLRLGEPAQALDVLRVAITRARRLRARSRLGLLLALRAGALVAAGEAADEAVREARGALPGGRLHNSAVHAVLADAASGSALGEALSLLLDGAPPTPPRPAPGP